MIWKQELFDNPFNILCKPHGIQSNHYQIWIWEIYKQFSENGRPICLTMAITIARQTGLPPVNIQKQHFVRTQSEWQTQHAQCCECADRAYSAAYRPISQIPECTCSISHNAPFRTEMNTFLFWAKHCGIWNRCILGFVNLVTLIGIDITIIHCTAVIIQPICIQFLGTATCHINLAWDAYAIMMLLSAMQILLSHIM